MSKNNLKSMFFAPKWGGFEFHNEPIEGKYVPHDSPIRYTFKHHISITYIYFISIYMNFIASIAFY